MKRVKGNQKTPPPPPAIEGVQFEFERLPVELKHEVFKKLSTGFLEEVCSLVNPEWQGMVTDIINQRAQKYQQAIPQHIQNEFETRIDASAPNRPIQMLKLYERSMVWKKYTLTPRLVSKDAIGPKKGIIYKLWNIRQCDCSILDECIVRSVHIMSILDLFVVQSTRELQFFHMMDLEHLSGEGSTEDMRSYQCDNDNACFENGSGVEISTFGDQIVAEEYARAILLLKVSSCDHENRKVSLQKLRRIFLPIWSRSLCLLEDKFFVLYTTGFVGMWDRSTDELSISPNACATQQGGQAYHTSKMFRVANLVFIKVQSRDSSRCRWYIIDPQDDNLEVYPLNMSEFITLNFLSSTWECVDVFYLDLWCNSFIVHCQGHPSASNELESRLFIKRIERYPELRDFVPPKEIMPPNIHNFLGETPASISRGKSVKLDGCVLAAFLPSSLKPWMLDPPDNEPIPVADFVALEWPLNEKRKRRKLRVHRVRLCNIPRRCRRQCR